MRVLIHSNSMTVPSGYGTQTALLALYLNNVGYDVAVASSYGHEGAPTEVAGILQYPRGIGPAGDSKVAEAANHFDADVVISFYDPFAIRYPFSENWGERKWVSWAAIDDYPLFHRTEHILKTGGPGGGQVHTVAFSYFGQRVLRRAGIDSDCIPLGVLPALFYPEEIPNTKFIIGMVGRNNTYPSRKGFPVALRAFKRFVEHVDGSARLRLHTVTGIEDGGMDLNRIIQNLGIENHVDIVDQAELRLGLHTPDDMRIFYNELSVLLQPSMAEGFGLPMVEAMACGVPVIGTDCSSITEILRGNSGGVLISGTEVDTVNGTIRIQAQEHEIYTALHRYWSTWKNKASRYLEFKGLALERSKVYNFMETTGPMWDAYLKKM